MNPNEVARAIDELAAPLERPDGEDPYAIQRDLQATMGRLVGIFRTEADLDEALDCLAELRARWAEHPGHRRPGLQPGLEPRLRAAQPARRLGGHRPQRPSAARRAAAPTAGSTTPAPDDATGARATASSPVTPRAG